MNKASTNPREKNSRTLQNQKDSPNKQYEQQIFSFQGKCQGKPMATLIEDHALQSQTTEINQQFLIAVEKEKPSFVFDFACIADIYNGLAPTYEAKRKKPNREIDSRYKKKDRNLSKVHPKEVNKKEQKEHKQANKLDRQLAKLLSPENVSNIESLVKEYQESLKDIYASETEQGITSFRCRKKIQLFKYTLVAYFELARQSTRQITPYATKTLQACKQNLKSYVISIVFDIDDAMIKYANSNLKTLKRQMEDQWSFLLKNMADPENTQLRNKIITGFYIPQEIATMEELEFYTSNKKLAILSKKKEYLQNFTISQPQEYRYQQYDEYCQGTVQYFPQFSDQASIASNKSNHLFNLKKIVKEVLLLGVQIPKKMKERLANELVNNQAIRNQLIGQYERTFSGYSLDESNFTGYQKYSFLMDWRYVEVKQDSSIRQVGSVKEDIQHRQGYQASCLSNDRHKRQKIQKSKKRMEVSSATRKTKKSAYSSNIYWPEMNQIMPKAEEQKFQDHGADLQCRQFEKKGKYSLRKKMNFKVEQYPGSDDNEESDTNCQVLNQISTQVLKEETSDSS